MRKAFQVQFPTTVQEDEGEDSEGNDNHDTDEDDGSEDGENDGGNIWEDLDGADAEVVNDTIINSKQRLSCFAHSLQLAIGDGLKETSNSGIGGVILKARKLSKLLHKSIILKER